MEQQWYIARNKQKIGPFSTAQMQQMATIGELLRNEMVLDSSQKKWCLAETVENLFSPVIKNVAPIQGPLPTLASPSLLSRYPILIGTSMFLVLLLCGFFFGLNKQKPHVSVGMEMVVAEKAEETKSPVVKQESSIPKEKSDKPEETKGPVKKQEPGTPKEESVKPEETKSQAEAKRLIDAGGIHLRKGQLEEAIKCYSESIQLDPSSHSGYDMRAYAFERAGKHSEAIADRTTVLEFFLLETPQKPAAIRRILVARGLSYIELGKHSEGRNDYSKAIKFDPENSLPYALRGLSYYSTDNHTESIMDFTKAINLDPESITELYFRGKSYLALNRKDEGLADLAKVKLMDPKRFSDLELEDLKRPVNKNNTATPKVEITNLDKDVKLEMVLIPAGKFMMGDTQKELDELEENLTEEFKKTMGKDFGKQELELIDLMISMQGRQHEVTISKPFYMGKYEVTQEQWEAVMGENPSSTKGAKLPVTDVSWEDCQDFIKKLNEKANGGYRLPTEAEWEYACRAGTTTAYSFGYKITRVDANYADSKIDKPLTVGNYKANAFGLYDMHGNIWEWCEDWFTAYPERPVMDPKGPATGKGRVGRGGSFLHTETESRSSFRYIYSPTTQDIKNGFRLTKTVEIEASTSPTLTKSDPPEVIPAGGNLLVSPFTEAKAKDVQKEVAKSLQKEVEEKADLDKDLKLEMVLIPAGKFLMGFPEKEKDSNADKTQHEVTLTKAFYIGKYEVTQDQWEAVMGNNPSDAKGAKLPVVNVSWLDCQEFIKKLNAEKNANYRLPSEAEWEFACKAGTTTAYSFGDKITPENANLGDSKAGKPLAVGSFKPNGLGLYDMHGNVWEWCGDWYGKYPDGAAMDPKGKVKGEDRVMRGGSFNLGESIVSSSYRLNLSPSDRSRYVGFRLARTVDAKTAVAEPAAPKSDPMKVMPVTGNLLVVPFTEAKAIEAQKEVANSLKKEVEERVNLGKGVNLEMVLVPAGKFMMGSPMYEKGRSNNEKQHEVTLTKPYYMGKYEVTQDQWEAVMGDNPSNTKGAKLPVTDVSWKDCQEFIKKLNAKTSGGYRLPTEAEWEYACRAGTTTRYFFGDEITFKDANYEDSNLNKIAKVGSYKPNGFRLYDTHGNVSEWCEDWVAAYPAGTITDPKGAATGDSRVVRGGAVGLGSSDARSSMRLYLPPSDRFGLAGFRLARTP
jgi:formylglycine-generating enzyme required for sulfatase activity